MSVEKKAKDLFKFLTPDRFIPTGFSYGIPCFPICICCGKSKYDIDSWTKWGPNPGQYVWHCSDCFLNWIQLMKEDEKTVARIGKEIINNWVKKFEFNKETQWEVKIY